MELRERVEAVLKTDVDPYIQGHNGGTELTSIEDGVAWVRMLGACANCPSAKVETRDFIEQTLMSKIPEIKGVEIDDSVNQDMLDFARGVLAGRISTT